MFPNEILVGPGSNMQRRVSSAVLLPSRCSKNVTISVARLSDVIRGLGASASSDLRLIGSPNVHEPLPGLLHSIGCFDRSMR